MIFMPARKKSEKRQVTNPGRRRLLGYGAAFVGGAASGFIGGYNYQPPGTTTDPFEITSEPYNLQIARFEHLLSSEDLAHPAVRSNYIWLLSLWYGLDKTFGIFTKRDTPYAAAERIYSAVRWIDSEEDEALKSNGNSMGWAVPQEYLVLNLTHYGFERGKSFNSSGAPLPPITTLRDVATHEFTHLIVVPQERAESFSVIKEMKNEYFQMANVSIQGFRIYLDPDPSDEKVPLVEVYDDFDEAATEVITKHWQTTSGIGPGLPAYSEYAIPGIERTIRVLRGTLDLLDIPVETFALYHAYSNLDGLAMEFAERANRRNTRREEIRFGMSLIEAIRAGDTSIIGEYLKTSKAS